MERLKDQLARPGYGSLVDGGAVDPIRVQRANEEACLSFHNVSYVIEKKLIRKQRKVVLNDVRYVPTLQAR